jgi:hypothetical protein
MVRSVSILMRACGACANAAKAHNEKAVSDFIAGIVSSFRCRRKS